MVAVGLGFKKTIFLSLLAVIILPGILAAQLSGNTFTKGEPRRTSLDVSWATRALQGDAMKVWLSNELLAGQEAWDAYTGWPVPPIGLEYPAGSGIEHLYGGGPVIGALVNSEVRLADGYRASFGTGYLQPDSLDTVFVTGLYDASGGNRAGVDDDADGLTDEDDLDGLDNDGDWLAATDDLGHDGLPDSLETGCKGGYDAALNPDPAFDNLSLPGIDSCRANRLMNDPRLYTQNNGLPDRGEPHVDEDFAAVSVKDIYCSATDRGPWTFPPKLGSRIIQKSYAWGASSAAEAIVFLDYSIVNTGDTLWENAYVGYKADMDVGPTTMGGYYQDDYARYDAGTRTAYVTSVADSLSTPLGLTLLGTSQAGDSLQDGFLWWFGMEHTWEDVDARQYSYLSCQVPPCISPDQSPEQPTDIRIMISTGPFQVPPAETLRATYALISGYGAKEMLNNARRAKRIYESRGFIMPLAREAVMPGNGFALAWSPVDRSPFGAVTAYRAYAGNLDGQWTDSLTTTDTTAAFLPPAAMGAEYFAVAAIDDRGNVGALSDIITRTPSIPTRLVADDGERGIMLHWNPNPEADIAGFNLYRRNLPDTSRVKVNAALIPMSEYFDPIDTAMAVFGYVVRAVDSDGNEGPPSDESTARLIPPARPVGIAVGPRAASIMLSWFPNTEPDLLGYNIHRSIHSDSGFVKLNPIPLDTPFFHDAGVVPETPYFYSIRAVDSTFAESPADYPVWARTAVFGAGIGVINAICCSPFGDRASASVLYDSLLENYQYAYTPSPLPDWISLSNRSTVYALMEYSTVLLLEETSSPASIPSLVGSRYPAALRGYLMAGGKLAIIGRNITAPTTSERFRFFRDHFGLSDSSVRSSADTIFAGAAGFQGFPDVDADTSVTASSGGSVDLVEYFPSVPPERVLASFRTRPFRDSVEGMPVGIRGVAPDTQLYYFSFPLLALEFDDAKALLEKILADFDEPTGIDMDGGDPLPQSYSLEQAYPNPFNPATTIRFSLPYRSRVVLRVFNMLGQVVSVLADGVLEPGHASVVWDGAGSASGVYLYRLEAAALDDRSAGFTDVKKIVLVK